MKVVSITHPVQINNKYTQGSESCKSVVIILDMSTQNSAPSNLKTPVNIRYFCKSSISNSGFRIHV